MLSHYVNKDLIFLNPRVKDKDDLFEKMVNHLYNLDYVIHKKDFLEALKKREALSNTELIPGVAFPHCRSDSVEKLFMSIVIIQDGIDYKNPDMGDAKIIFFFGTSNKYNKEYLQLLAKSARLLKNDNFRNKLLASTTPAQVMSVLDEFDKEEAPTVKPEKKYQMVITFHLANRLNDLLSSLVETGINNASVIESDSLSSRISYDVPVFSGLYFTEESKKNKSYLILSHINDIDDAQKVVNLLKENGIDFNKKGTGFVQVLEADEIIGCCEEEIEL